MDKNNFTPEQILKARAAGSPEELIALAKENGTELTEDAAKEYYGLLHTNGELSDDELDSVAGGSNICAEDPDKEKKKLPQRAKDPRGYCESYTCGKCGAVGLNESMLSCGCGQFCNGCSQWADCETCAYGIKYGGCVNV